MEVYEILKDLGIIGLIGFIVTEGGKYFLKRYAPHIFSWLKDQPQDGQELEPDIPFKRDTAVWYCQQGSQQEGPLTGRELRQLLGDGQVQTSTLVWRQGMTYWAALRAVEHELPTGRRPRIGLPPRPPFINIVTVTIAVYVLVFIIGIAVSQSRW